MLQHIPAQLVLYAGPMDLEDIEEQAEGGSWEIDNHDEREGGSCYQRQRQADEDGVEIYIELAHLLHESLGAVVVLGELVHFWNFGVEGLEADGGVGLFVFYAFALTVLWAVDRGCVDLLLDEPDGEEERDDEEGEKLHEYYDLLAVLQNC